MLQARTTADTWRAHPAYGRVPALQLTAAAGLSVYVVLLTAGEASPYAAPSADRHALATLRLAEMENALHRLAPDNFLVFLGAPDGEVATSEHQIAASLTDLLGDASRTFAGRAHVSQVRASAEHPSSPAARPRCPDACSRTTRVPTSTT